MRWLTLTALIVLAGCEALVPREDFAETTPPPAPDYARDDAWAALPERDDLADVVVAGESDGQASAEVDVFFVHPTTYYSPASWNQPLDHEATNDRTDEAVLRNQASAYNAAGRVFAPRYRQATLGAFVTSRRDEADAALDLAYGDVLAAFDQFMAERNDGRPLLIASHSQGTRHAVRLLSERFSDLADDPSRRERLVAAYIVGFAVPVDALTETTPGIPRCETPTQTGCWLTWSSVRVDTEPDRFDEAWVWYPGGARTVTDPTMVCVNPVSWLADDAWSPFEAHEGAARFDGDDPPQAVSGAVSARCTARGLLEVDTTDEYDPGRADDYHIHDYGLFYLDVRRNAAARVAAFLGG